ncbi:MAG: ABC transporter permease [Deltaproteobacteria bacterium]|nr:ABC transporter permease [Deltaproteobacteria bacterium]
MQNIKSIVKDFSRIFQYKSLIWMLVAKELKARYRGTFFGFLWSFLNPLLAMLTYVLVFSIYMKVQMENYSVFLLSGLLPWFWFSSAVNEASNSIIANGGLIKKISMPMEIFPLVYVASNLLNFILSIPVLLALLFIMKVHVGPALLVFPVLVFIQFIFTFGFALIVSSVTVKFRDFLYLIPNVIQIWYFLTPIMYPATVIPEKYAFFLKLNPFAQFAVAYQDIFLHNRFPSFSCLLNSAAFSCFFMIIGIFIFQGFKQSFPEEV